MGRRYQRNDNVYVIGSNAASFTTFQEIPEFDHKNDVAINSKQKNPYSINPAYTFLLASVIIAMLIICVVMLKAQFTVADTSEQIISYKHELEDLRRINDKLEASIKETMDLNEIRRIAMEEYGMVLRNDMNTFFIKNEELTYTEQYAPVVPKNDEKLSIGNVLGLISKGW